MSKPLVAYFRVSTREQGRSGLGIDAQREAVARFAAAEGSKPAKERMRSSAARNSQSRSPSPAITANARSRFPSSIASAETSISFPA